MTPRDARMAVVRQVAEARRLPLERVMGRDRHAIVVRARQAAMARLRAEFGDSYPKIGRFFGRDHSTVLHAVRAHGAREGAR